MARFDRQCFRTTKKGGLIKNVLNLLQVTLNPVQVRGVDKHSNSPLARLLGRIKKTGLTPQCICITLVLGYMSTKTISDHILARPGHKQARNKSSLPCG